MVLMAFSYFGKMALIPIRNLVPENRLERGHTRCELTVRLTEEPHRIRFTVVITENSNIIIADRGSFIRQSQIRLRRLSSIILGYSLRV